MMGTALLSLLALLLQSQVASPQGLPELPLVVREGGWARYEAVSSDGPARFIIKVGAPGRHQGKRGRWFDLVVEVPSLGRTSIQFLVEGERFSASSLLLVRATLPGEKPRDTSRPFQDETSTRRQGRFLQKKTVTVSGKVLEVMEYSFPGGTTAEWSAAVPGLGLVNLSGEDPFHLVAFGVGGDPWKEK
ncbi:hypothetical protein MYSTI_00800 [Myxococcus stipitatus DSM 14675]|uniref:Lipoprotein n=1 Tax=Myxococcus stipitatus (strain DSM 14675 / JCM 12634 / Mx s8) TaxID=1278073 RepID=L7U6P5_MYXSD|nr:hypothetical protein [Myxococcus stipitatus]AGC42149.1 hypothetical protein MYSTI_00800 [Myxococcus stipitatus DSM 14675]